MCDHHGSQNSTRSRCSFGHTGTALLSIEDVSVCGRRDRGPVGVAEAHSAEIFLRQRRLAACSRISLARPNITRPAARTRSCACRPARSCNISRPAPRWSNSAAAPASRCGFCSMPRSKLKAYVPVDISGEFLAVEAERLRQDYPKLVDPAGGRRFHAAIRAAGAGRGLAEDRFLPRLDDRQFRAARGLRVPAPCRRHSRARRGAWSWGSIW